MQRESVFSGALTTVCYGRDGTSGCGSGVSEACASYKCVCVSACKWHMCAWVSMCVGGCRQVSVSVLPL